MGGAESKKNDNDISELMFDEEERKKVVFIFATIAHGRKVFDEQQFQNFTSHVLDGVTSSRLYDMIQGPLGDHNHRKHQKHEHQEIHLHHFASHVALLLKGTDTNLAKACVFLASGTHTTVSRTELVTFVGNILHSYERFMTAHCTAYQSWILAPPKDSYSCLANSLLNDTLISDTSKSTEHETFDESDIRDWLSRCKFFSQVLSQVFQGALQFYNEPRDMVFTPRMPRVRDTDWSRCNTMLDFPTVLYLNFALNYNLQTQWKQLFNSATHGASFSQLLQSIRNKGPTYTIVRDKEGHSFGGFAGISWDINSKFTGSTDCFIFKVSPFFSIYRPTGYNENYMYLNYHVQTLPNGLGMGGQLEYFGLWIDQEFDHGHSKAGSKGCTTYGSPQLSGQTEFQVDSLEVWAVGKVKKNDDDESDDADEEDSVDQAGARSILDKVASEDKAILDMVGRSTTSDHMREEPLVEETAVHSTIISPY